MKFLSSQKSFRSHSGGNFFKSGGQFKRRRFLTMTFNSKVLDKLELTFARGSLRACREVMRPLLAEPSLLFFPFRKWFVLLNDILGACSKIWAIAVSIFISLIIFSCHPKSEVVQKP